MARKSFLFTEGSLKVENKEYLIGFYQDLSIYVTKFPYENDPKMLTF